MNRRCAALVLVAVVGLAVQAFCAGSQDAAAKPAERPKVTLMRSTGQNAYAVESPKPDDIYYREMSRLSGVEVSWEFLEHNNQNQLLALRFASGELPDTFITYSVDSPNHPGAVQAGVFLDLTDLLPKYAPNVWARMPPAYWKNPNVSYDGRIWGIPYLQPLPAWRVVYYRRDWVDKLGMKPPVTLDDYLAIFAKIKATDMDGNGLLDEIPYGCRENLSYSDLPWGTFGVYPSSWRLRDGKVQSDMIAPAMREALEFWKKLYANGYVNQDLWTTKAADWIKSIQSGKTGFWTHDAMNATTTWAPDKYPKDAVVDALPGPRDASGATPLAPESDAFGGIWVINAKTKDPVAVLKLFDWAWSEDIEKEKFFTFGVKGHNYTEENGRVTKFDASLPQNVKAVGFFQVILSLKGDYRMNPLILGLYPNGDTIRRAIAAAEQSTFEHASKNMPVFDAVKENPSLLSGAGSLFLDMAAKVITGKADSSVAFAAFVAEWKRRGGDAWTEQVNSWYAKSR